MQAAKRVCAGSRLSQLPITASPAQSRNQSSRPFQLIQRPAERLVKTSHALQQSRAASAETTAKELSQQSVDELEDGVAEDDSITQAKEKQHQRPWMREGADHSPVRRQRSAGAMTKGSSPSSDLIYS